MANMMMIRMLMQKTTDDHMLSNHMDVKTAYLKALIDCDIYVKAPEGYKEYDDDGKEGVEPEETPVWLSQNLLKPTQHDLAVARGVLRYLKGTLHYGVMFKTCDRGESKVQRYCDED